MIGLTRQRHTQRLVAACALLTISFGSLVACGTTTTEAFPTPALTTADTRLPMSTPGPVPGAVVKFPEDEAPHNAITEWWYYTGHLETADGERYGLEYTIFQGSRADFPLGYAVHFAVIDAQQKTFAVDQATSFASNPIFGGTNGFNLQVNDWSLQGANGTDTMRATMHDGTYAIDLTARDVVGPTLEGGGQFSYGPGGSSYYYSRTRMVPSGTLTVHGVAKQVTGGALWFDHQWGNFLPTAGGWDWFSTQLDDNTAIMIYNLRDAKGNILQTFGEYVPGCNGTCSPTKPTRTQELDRGQFTITPVGTWVSPTTGITYPSGWHIQIRASGDVPAMDLTYTPVIPNAELDTRQTTSVVYWEGDTHITGTKGGAPITGSGYVELTGYDKGKT